MFTIDKNVPGHDGDSERARESNISIFALGVVKLKHHQISQALLGPIEPFFGRRWMAFQKTFHLRASLDRGRWSACGERMF